MQADIAIDDELMNQAMRVTGIKTKAAVVDIALRSLIAHANQDKLAEAFGKFHWEGDLDAMRTESSSFALNAEQWEAFLTALDAPPRRHPRMERLLNEPTCLD